MSATAGVFPAEPVLSMAQTAPAATYVVASQQPVQYVTSQPVTYMQQPQQVVYQLADGQTVMGAESQAMGGSAAAPVTYEYSAAAPVTYAAPAVYSISPERFAQIAAGIPLTQEEIDAMLGGTAAPAAVPVAGIEPVMEAAAASAAGSASAAGAAATTSAKAEKKKSSSKKKSLKASKKKKAGCC